MVSSSGETPSLSMGLGPEKKIKTQPSETGKTKNQWLSEVYAQVPLFLAHPHISFRRALCLLFYHS